MLTKSLTIVLPVYNGESRLRRQVREMLDLAGELTSDFRILIVDDGSTDATFEVADDLAARYPQVRVRRHRNRAGIGPAIEYVRRNVSSDAVIVHDGITPIDCNQMRKLWRSWLARIEPNTVHRSDSGFQAQDMCDFSNLPAIHATLERAHSQVLGFELIAPAKVASPPDDDQIASDSLLRTDAAFASKRSGVGEIPRLPRPKFLSAVAQFAFGE